MPVDLARLKVLAEAATPGPYKADCDCVHQWDDETNRWGFVLNVAHCGHSTSWKGIHGVPLDYGQSVANAAFIAATDPQTILALIHVADAAEKHADACYTQGVVSDHAKDARVELNAALRALKESDNAV